MARKPSPEIDDELFNEVYGKEYTGPPGSTSNNATVKGKPNKTSIVDQSDEEQEPLDPNAVPTDFTSREAKVWEAKAKATERNWKKRKEEEMICKICGEAGHFTQGCPSTLGANRKTAECFERVPARDKHVRSLFTEKMISQIEKDVGCKIKMDEKFLIVSGKDGLVLSKGVDAVHRVMQDDNKGKKKSPTSSKRMRSRSPVRSPIGSHLRRSESQKYSSSPRDAPRFQTREFNQEKVIEDNVRDDLPKLRGPPHARAANEGAKGRPARSRSPLRATFGGNSFGSYDSRNLITGMHNTNSWDVERHGTDSHSERKYDYSSYPQTLEEAEMEFKREAMELGRIRDKEEDEENYKHRECTREVREEYMKKLALMRGVHTKQWEEFLQLDMQRRQQQARHNAYNQQPSYPDYDPSSRNSHNPGSGLPMDSRARYPYPSENYMASSRPHDAYGELQQRQLHDDFDKAYGRF